MNAFTRTDFKVAILQFRSDKSLTRFRGMRFAIHFAQQMCQCLKHSSLAPMEHRRLDFLPAQIPVVKMPVLRLHIIDCPLGNLGRHFERVGVSIRKKSQGIYCLGNTLNVYGAGFVVVVLRTAICFKEMEFEILKTAREGSIQTPGLRYYRCIA